MSVKKRVDNFLDDMQRAPHKGIAEGSSFNNFQKGKGEIASIDTPFGASLTESDKFADLRPTTLHIEDCTPAAVGQALNAGLYVDTRSAPIVSDTQEVVRKCFDYLWQCKMRGDEEMHLGHQRTGKGNWLGHTC